MEVIAMNRDAKGEIDIIFPILGLCKDDPIPFIGTKAGFDFEFIASPDFEPDTCDIYDGLPTFDEKPLWDIAMVESSNGKPSFTPDFLSILAKDDFSEPKPRLNNWWAIFRLPIAKSPNNGMLGRCYGFERDERCGMFCVNSVVWALHMVACTCDFAAVESLTEIMFTFEVVERPSTFVFDRGKCRGILVMGTTPTRTGRIRGRILLNRGRMRRSGLIATNVAISPNVNHVVTQGAVRRDLLVNHLSSDGLPCLVELDLVDELAMEVYLDAHACNGYSCSSGPGWMNIYRVDNAAENQKENRRVIKMRKKTREAIPD
ncbi:long-chain acyl-CoA synthetase 4 [Striga asiatica]|uniref:Long-chain acyl-CoA synthetase 4 n=1 Tax=Striga asiatica TaxID=4170 RepID=A0A5A7PN53_STRAF|nr:long-chain acyl-CoA synthetase 4 [Striga asiatica]